jgi:squalene synthase HpnC
VAGGSRGTRERAHRTERADVRPSITHADEVLANASGENFPVALRILPRATRQRLYALYCFARFTDDLGDQAEAEAEADGNANADADAETKDTQALRLRLLDELDQDIDRIYAGQQPATPALRPLVKTVRDCAIPERPFRDLIQANRQDQHVTRYQDYAELEHYCTLSANPVGLIVLHIFGVATPERIALSDNICTALQLIEHWQDVAEDLRDKGRIYLPQDDMAKFNVTEDDLRRPHANHDVRALMAFETDRASRLLSQGAPLVGTLPRTSAARLAVAGFLSGGRSAAKAIERSRFDVLSSTPRAAKPATARQLVSTYLKGR